MDKVKCEICHEEIKEGDELFLMRPGVVYHSYRCFDVCGDTMNIHKSCWQAMLDHFRFKP
jgi:hypothetical protein